MDINKNHMNLAMQGALILTIAGLLTKILSAAYRVPYQNIVGDIGYYIYQQVYPFYGMSVILATSGFPVMISKIMSDYGYGHSINIRSKIITITLLYLTGIGVILSAFLYILSTRISMFMGDAKLAPLIQVASISFLMIPFVSLFRGYFQSEQNMQPTAISQVVEQGIRVSFILLSSFFMIKLGYDLYTTGIGAIFSSIIGSLAGLLLLIYLWIRKGYYSLFTWNLKAPISSWTIVKSLAMYSFTIGISSLLLIFIQMIDALNLYAVLVNDGMQEDLAKKAKGIYDRGQPLIQLGTVVATSFALSLVPAISNAKLVNDETFIREKLQLSLKLCVVVGAGASVGLITLMRPINTMLFTNDSSTFVLMVLSGSIVFTSICLTLFAISQGLGFTFLPAIAVLVGTGLKYGMNLLFIPIYGVVGAAFSTLLSYAAVAIFIMLFLSYKGYSLKEYKSIGKIGISLAIMVGVLVIVLTFVNLYIDLDSRINATIIALFGVMLGGSIYGLCVLKIKVFSKEEIQYIPVLNKLLK